MKLRNKLLAGFLSVVAIIVVMGVVMSFSLRDMGERANSVDLVDSALFEVLQAQGHMLRFLTYKDEAFIPMVRETLSKADSAFKRADTFLKIPENKRSVEARINEVKELNALFDQMLANERRRVEIENSLAPLVADLLAKLARLTENRAELIRQEYSPEVFDLYVSTITVGDAVREARLMARFYVAEPSPEREQRALDAIRHSADTIRALEGKAKTPENAQIVREVLTLAENYEKGFRQMIATTTGTRQTALAVRNATVELTRQAIILSSASTTSLLELASWSQVTMAVGTGLVIVLCLLIALLLTRNVLRQLGKDPGELAHVAQRVTHGDFNIDDGSPTIGVYGNIVRMVDTLKENITKAQSESERAHDQSRKAQDAMVDAEKASNDARAKTQSLLVAADKLEEVANIVSSASAELSAQIEQSERGAAEQASRVTETATAMEEMNSTVLEVAKNASSASDVSSSTRQKAEAGAEIVRRAVTSIQAVQVQAVQLKADMTKLDENARSISQIMSVISDIADQTNLLALNAAIEAARAGEAGRGFAVVADEVRKLAEKTMASTTDVGNAIRSIQTSASQSMAQMDASVKTIEEATGFANQSGAALQEIVMMVDSTADQVRAIATASEQQSASSEEINLSINQINTIATETARAMQEAAHAVSDLASQAQVLGRLIDDMKRG